MKRRRRKREKESEIRFDFKVDLVSNPSGLAVVLYKSKDKMTPMEYDEKGERHGFDPLETILTSLSLAACVFLSCETC